MEELIKTAEKELIDALRNNDVVVFESKLHQDLFFRIPSGEMVGKKDHVENMRSGDLKILDLTTQDQRIQVVGDNAIVSVIKKMKGNYKGDTFEGTFHYIRVWKQEEDKLQVIGGAGVQV